MDEQLKNTFYQISIEIDFENIFSYCKFTESALLEEKKKIKNIYEEKVGKLEPKEKESFDHFLIDADWKLNSVFPKLQWSSIFNSSYTLFEKHLNDLCKKFGKERSKEIGLKDIKGKGIERAKIYLSKVIGITNIFDSTEWREIQDYAKVRNVLVHTNGNLDLSKKNHKDVFNIANNHPNLFVYPEVQDSDSAEIAILPEYIYETLITYRIILSKICQYKLQNGKS